MYEKLSSQILFIYLLHLKNTCMYFLGFKQIYDSRLIFSQAILIYDFKSSKM